MRLPQSILWHFSVRTVHLLTIGIATALVGMATASAGAATAQLACTPSNLHFGDVVVGHSETLLVTVTNNGETSVTLSGITVGTSEFTRSDLSLPLVFPAGHSVELSVKFTPTAKVETTAVIEFSSDASNPDLVLDVAGKGVSTESLTVTPSSVVFGGVEKDSTSTVTVVLKNDGSTKVDLSALQITGSEFSMRGPTFPLTLSSGQSTTVDVTFAPQSTGTVGGSLFVFGPAMAIPLTGSGTVPQYSVNLFWNSTPDVEGYNVYRSPASGGPYSKVNSTLDANAAYTDSTVVSGQTYYYAATSVSASGEESARSMPPVEAAIP
jgi:hypothetical protein